jgi:cation diffusion facilitator family transporter
VDDEDSSVRTVLVAAGVNVAIAAAKLVAAVLTGSASMWAEAAHSLADTGNEVLLFVGLRKSRRGPDARHPFGYGQERFFWAFLAALGIFLIGGALSVGEGIRSLLLPEPLESVWVGIAVLLVAGVLEAYSWRTARRQLRDAARARDRSMIQQLRRSTDPSAGTVYLEDSAALAGIAVALAALVLHAVTGAAVWDAVGSVSVGALLLAVAVLLARRTKSLLLDEAAPPDVMAPLRGLVSTVDWTAGEPEVRAVVVGPAQLLVDVRATPADRMRDTAELVREVDRLRRRLLEVPAIVDATVTLVPPRG